VNILETERLLMRELDSAIDAEFILELLNSPGFLKYIGDRGVRDVEQSRDFIEGRFKKSYAENGYGLYAVALKSEGRNAIGICGFVKREGLTDADLGFAFLPQFERKGYGFESASAALRHGRSELGLTRILAITSLNNDNSVRLLEKLGFVFDRLIKLPHSDEELKLFRSDA
jgi:RimJ/RimL family protein N-acetyltransferase